MIAGFALAAAPAGVAFAADATADASPMATMNTSASAPAAAPVQTLRAAAEDTAEAATTGEIVVTGSRIPQPNLSSVSPIQAVGHQEFQLAGHTDVIDLLNTLPSNFQVNTADFSNTSNPLTAPGGITTADLRGLGPQRTLVLVNGRRLGVGDPNTANPNPAPDLDQIPVALIDHVEITTGGASATYGSDAIAGVVNFIMKTDFEGVQLDGTFGGDEHDQHNGFMQSLERKAGITPPTGSTWDGENTDFSVIMGTNAPDGKGNVTGYFEFKHTTPIAQGARDFSDCLYDLAVVAPLADGVPGPVCAGSSNSNYFLPRTGPNAGNALSVLGSNFVTRPAAGSAPPAAFNSSPYEYLSRDDDRYLAGFFAHYEITPWAQPYAEFMFMHDSSNSNIAPSGAFRGSALDGGDVDINCNNPLLSAQEATQLCGGAAGTSTIIPVQLGRRNIEGGPRTADFEHENYRIVHRPEGRYRRRVALRRIRLLLLHEPLHRRGRLPQHPGHAERAERRRHVRQSGVRDRRRLRALEHLRHRPGDPGGAELPDRARHRARHDRREHLRVRRHRRPRQIRLEAALGQRRDRRQRRHREPLGPADLRARPGRALRRPGRLLGGVSGGQQRHRRRGRLLRDPHPDRPEAAVRLRPLPRGWRPLLGLFDQRRGDHLQGRRPMVAGSGLHAPRLV